MAQAYSTVVGLVFPTRQEVQIPPPKLNLAPMPLNIGNSWIFIALLSSLQPMLMDSLKKQAKNL